MNFEKQTDGRLKVEMDAADLLCFGLDYHRLDYTDEKTRVMVKSLLCAAETATGYRTDAKRLTIEVFPANSGGCVIYFSPSGLSDSSRGSGEKNNMTVKSGSARLKKVRMKPEIFEFENSEEMLAAIGRLYRADIKTGVSSLYEMDGKYALVMRKNRAVRAVRALLSDYSRISGTTEVDAAYIEEHGKLLSSPNAVEEIGQKV